MTAEVELPRGMVALVDADDLELVQQYRWCVRTHRPRRTSYAVTCIRRPGGRWAMLRMHRLLLGLTDSGVHVDHTNRDGLDNRRENLRICSPSENQWNRDKNRNNTSGYKGVSWHNVGGKWMARLQAHGKNHYLGLFTTAAEAHLAYCLAADELHGKFKNYGDSV